MARNGSGVMSIPYSDIVAHSTSNSDHIDANNADIVTELTNSIPRDGQAAPTANIPWGSYKITGLGNGSADTDSINYGQVRTGTLTLTNKTIDLTSNTLTGTTAQFNTALSDGNFATLAGSETLTNKTLTAPVIATISNTGTLTLPTSTDTLVGRATTDTLTNKTISTGCTYDAGAVTSNGAVTGASFVPTGAGVPVKGIYLPAANTLGWSVNSTEYLRLDATGFNIGMTGGTARFNVTALSAQNVANLRNYDDTGRGIAFLNSSGSTVGSIIWGAASTAYNTSSDYRLKENVRGLNYALSSINRLRPVTFNFKNAPDRKVDGFLAHEVQEVIRYAVTGKKDEMDESGNPVYQSIDHSKLVPLLVAAVQELSRKIDNLTKKLEG